MALRNSLLIFYYPAVRVGMYRNGNLQDLAFTSHGAQYK